MTDDGLIRKARRLDARDLQILAVVQARGRISKRELAKTVGMSLTPCNLRLLRLEEAGVICGYKGVLDARRLGTFVWVHTNVTLSRHRASDFARFESAVGRLPEVVECDAVGGGIDYVLKLVVRDVSHYQVFMERLLELQVGVSSYSTYFVTHRAKSESAIPLAALLGGRVRSS